MPESEQPYTSSIPPAVRVFVYGTLQPGEKYHQAYCGSGLLAAEPAIAMGQLYHLPLGYPGLAAGADAVHGSLLSFEAATILQRLDELEDYSPQREPSQNLYQREQTMVLRSDGTELGQAWVYRMTMSRIREIGGVYLPGGNWSSAIASRLSGHEPTSLWPPNGCPT